MSLPQQPDDTVQQHTAPGKTATLRVFRGEGADQDTPRQQKPLLHDGQYVDFEVPLGEGWVVLDAIHWIQANKAPDLAVRWNCKAAKCGSCSAEVNGLPSLMCKTRIDDFTEGEPITVRPMKTFPLVKDLVTDVSWNYEVNKKIPPFKGPDTPVSTWRYYQEEADRVQEFRKCIECFLCQDTCHVLRNHAKFEDFYGPRFMIRLAQLEMHPLDQDNRMDLIKNQAGIGYCNITKCCTERCPEEIRITDNGIIPLKERVVDYHYDPITVALRKLGLTKA